MRYKIILPAVLLLVSAPAAYPQNLVANGSFEDQNICTEYNSPCSPAAWKTTSPFLLTYGRYQSNKMVGFIVYNPSVSNARQYLQTKLLCPLVKDVHYRLSFKLRADNLILGSMGALFSDSVIFGRAEKLIMITPTIDFSGQMAKISVQNSVKWNKVTVDYLARGFEKYLVIGNFDTDRQQKRTFLVKPQDQTYYMYQVDDVELMPLDQVALCPDLEKTRAELYNSHDRHPIKKFNMFGDYKPEEDSMNAGKNIDTIRLSNVLFRFDSFQVDPHGKTKLDSIFQRLNKTNIEFIKIHGFTDSMGTHEYNTRLSFNRANTIREYLSTWNLSGYISEVKGYGEEFPLASNSTADGRQTNRRVEVIVKYKNIKP